MPGHPFRPSVFGSSKRKKGVKEQPSTTKSVHLIDCLEKESDDPGGGGGTPMRNRRGCSSEILNLTPKGDQSGRGLSKF